MYTREVWTEGLHTYSSAPCTLIHISRNVERTQVSSRWMDKMWCTRSHRKERNSDTCHQRMYLENVMPSEISQTYKTTNILWFHSHKISRMGKIRQRQSKLEVTRGAGVRGELLLNDCREFLFGEMKSFESGRPWWWCNTVRVIDSTELHTWKRLGWRFVTCIIG